MSFSFDREVRQAVKTINRLIEMSNESGGSVHLVRQDDKEFSIKLTHPIDIISWEPMIRYNTPIYTNTIITRFRNDVLSGKHDHSEQ